MLNCTEPLGLGAKLPAHMITASSNNDAVTNLTLDGKSGWKPLYSTPGEWIMVSIIYYYTDIFFLESVLF